MDVVFSYVAYDGAQRSLRAKSVPDPQKAANYLAELVESTVLWRA